MPIKVTVCYLAECDECGNNFEHDYVPHFDNSAEAKEMVRDCEGVVYGDHVWCELHVPPCTCGHLFGEHDYGDGPCEDCPCDSYTP